MFLERMTLPLIAAGLLAGCNATSVDAIEPSDAGVTPGRDASLPGDAGPQPSFAKSERANLRFKRDVRLGNDLAQILSLPKNQVCNELGQYSCTDQVHTISLGGVEPYQLGLNVAFDNTTATTPLATERVVLYACEQRATLDLGDSGDKLFFGNLEVDDGKLADVDAENVAAAIDLLYKRSILRPPSTREVTHMRQLYRDIEADGSPEPARDWAILSCFSVLTSMEALFY